MASNTERPKVGRHTLGLQGSLATSFLHRPPALPLTPEPAITVLVELSGPLALRDG